MFGEFVKIFSISLLFCYVMISCSYDSKQSVNISYQQASVLIVEGVYKDFVLEKLGEPQSIVNQFEGAKPWDEIYIYVFYDEPLVGGKELNVNFKDNVVHSVYSSTLFTVPPANQ
ncbi:MAG: hypothetical protein AAGA80_28020 [Cyanobacteria bacterium P01_F01_bin.143]